MASQVGGDLSRIKTGPCSVTFKGMPLGHTMGGVRFNIAPQTRDRNVDEYGDHRADIVHTGDDVTISTTLAETSLSVLQTVYQMSYGAIDANTIGIGNLPGGLGSEKAGPLLLHPLRAGETTTEDVLFHKAVVNNVGEVQFGVIQEEQVYEVTWAALIDETKATGQMIGQIGVPS